MDVKKLINNPPKIHEDVVKGNLTSYQISNSLLYFLDKIAKSNSKTLETGAGVSTILFAIKEADHICISPNHKEVKRIINYCKQNKINTKKIKFYINKSQDKLPGLKCKPLDIVLIDGLHSFPTPFIDWYYAEKHLKIGGYLIIDDIELVTGKILKDFLMSEPEWKLIGILEKKSAIFKKLGTGSPDKGWQGQPYLVRKPKEPKSFINKIFKK